MDICHNVVAAFMVMFKLIWTYDKQNNQIFPTERLIL